MKLSFTVGTVHICTHCYRVYGAIRRIKNNRTPGENAITAELIKEEAKVSVRISTY
jgi:hypothetical protein